MNNQRRTIMGACDYALATLQQLRKDLMDVGAKDHDITWAIGGIVSTLTANILQTCHTVFTEAAQSGEADVKKDLTEIQFRLNEFIGRMINQE